MTDKSKSPEWLSQALFQVEKSTGHKTNMDVNLIHDEVLDRIAKLNERQKLSLLEYLGIKGREQFLQAGTDVTGSDIPTGLQYIFSLAIRESVLAVVRATEETELACHYCLEPVDPEAEEACKQATLWVSGAKWQNTRLRRYTGAWAHKKCVEAHAEKPDTAQEELEF